MKNIGLGNSSKYLTETQDNRLGILPNTNDHRHTITFIHTNKMETTTENVKDKTRYAFYLQSKFAHVICLSKEGRERYKRSLSYNQNLTGYSMREVTQEKDKSDEEILSNYLYFFKKYFFDKNWLVSASIYLNLYQNEAKKKNPLVIEIDKDFNCTPTPNAPDWIHTYFLDRQMKETEKTAQKIQIVAPNLKQDLENKQAVIQLFLAQKQSLATDGTYPFTPEQEQQHLSIYQSKVKDCPYWTLQSPNAQQIETMFRFTVFALEYIARKEKGFKFTFAKAPIHKEQAKPEVQATDKPNESKHKFQLLQMSKITNMLNSKMITQEQADDMVEKLMNNENINL
jgi:hypothetical protein